MKTFSKFMSLFVMRWCGSMLPHHRITNNDINLLNVFISI